MVSTGGSIAAVNPLPEIDSLSVKQQQVNLATKRAAPPRVDWGTA